MELVNRSRLPVEITTCLDKSGRERLLLVAKATYHFGEDGRPPELATEAQPIAHTDIFQGEPGLSAPLYEADFAMIKKRCDVIMDATAHTPHGRPVTELDIAVRVGLLSKRLLITGDRVWQKGSTRIFQSRPQPFASMPLHYGRAFGGSPRHGPKAEHPDAYLANPVGRGYCSDPWADAVEQMPLPNIEDRRDRISSPDSLARPVALGPIGRHWHPRRTLAGTYDADWRQNLFPLLPQDFEEDFFQAAPVDQQIEFVRGGEEVVLQHLLPDRPIVTFKLPRPELPVKVLYTTHRAVELSPVVDTLFIEPEARRFSMVYRTTLPLDRRSTFGINMIAVGPVCKRWWQSKVLGTEDCGCGGDSKQDAADEGGDSAFIDSQASTP